MHPLLTNERASSCSLTHHVCQSAGIARFKSQMSSTRNVESEHMKQEGEPNPAGTNDECTNGMNVRIPMAMHRHYANLHLGYLEQGFLLLIFREDHNNSSNTLLMSQISNFERAMNNDVQFFIYRQAASNYKLHFSSHRPFRVTNALRKLWL